MSIGNVKRGLARLFFVLTLAWAVFCAVVCPMWYQSGQQREAFSNYERAVKNCDQLLVEAPGWEATKDCYQRAEENWQGALRLFSFEKFYLLDYVFWWLLLPAIILPPLGVYVLAALMNWVWRGFKVTASDVQKYP